MPWEPPRTVFRSLARPANAEGLFHRRRGPPKAADDFSVHRLKRGATRLGAWRPASHVERQRNSAGPMPYALILRYKVLGSIASSAAALPRWPFTCLSTDTMC